MTYPYVSLGATTSDSRRCYLGVSLDNGHAPRSVRLFGVGPEKIIERFPTRCSLRPLFLHRCYGAPLCGQLWQDRGGGNRRLHAGWAACNCTSQDSRRWGVRNSHVWPGFGKLWCRRRSVVPGPCGAPAMLLKERRLSNLVVTGLHGGTCRNAHLATQTPC